MGKVRRSRPQTVQTNSQKHRRKRLQYFANTASLSHRTEIEGWDDRKTLIQNYKNLGISTDANKSVDGNYLVPVAPAGMMTAKLDEFQALPKRAAYEAKSMSVQEQYRLQALVRKHGDDFEAMARDIRLNTYQCTARQLEKRIAVMTRLQSSAADDTDDEGEAEEEGASKSARKTESLGEEIMEEAMTRALELIDVSKLAEDEFNKLFERLDADMDDEEVSDETDAAARAAEKKAVVDAALAKAAKKGAQGKDLAAIKAEVLADRGLTEADVAKAEKAARLQAKAARKHTLSAEPTPLIAGVVGKKLKGRLQEMPDGSVIVKPRLIQQLTGQGSRK